MNRREFNRLKLGDRVKHRIRGEESELVDVRLNPDQPKKFILKLSTGMSWFLDEDNFRMYDVIEKK